MAAENSISRRDALKSFGLIGIGAIGAACSSSTLPTPKSPTPKSPAQIFNDEGFGSEKPIVTDRINTFVNSHRKTVTIALESDHVIVNVDDVCEAIHKELSTRLENEDKLEEHSFINGKAEKDVFMGKCLDGVFPNSLASLSDDIWANEVKIEVEENDTALVKFYPGLRVEDIIKAIQDTAVRKEPRENIRIGDLEPLLYLGPIALGLVILVNRYLKIADENLRAVEGKLNERKQALARTKWKLEQKIPRKR